MSRVVTLSDTNRLSSGTQMRRRCTLTCCHRFVLMFECETLCALSLRLPVMSLLAMVVFTLGGGGETDGGEAFCQGLPEPEPCLSARPGAWAAAPAQSPRRLKMRRFKVGSSSCC